jgi:hypothetical protein
MAIPKKRKTRGGTRGLFIIESLEREDEESRCEGVILNRILTLSGSLPVKYIYIRTKPELSMALKEFKASRYRYLHISCHGSEDSISLTLDQLPFEEFACIIAPYLSKRRVFFSACSVVNQQLAKSLLDQCECYSIIGPCREIRFDDALMMWACFYHLAFRDENEAKLRCGKIRWALRRVKRSFGEEFHYYRRTEDGRWGRGEIEKR